MHTELGMAPLDALRTATAAAADLLGVERGRIRPGAPADVLLLARDVTENLTALREPAVVVKDGAIVRERA
jgi:imidazolonepropionase-like amidohydrolase